MLTSGLKVVDLTWAQMCEPALICFRASCHGRQMNLRRNSPKRQRIWDKLVGLVDGCESDRRRNMGRIRGRYFVRWVGGMSYGWAGNEREGLFRIVTSFLHFLRAVACFSFPVAFFIFRYARFWMATRKVVIGLVSTSACWDHGSFIIESNWFSLNNVVLIS